MHNDDFISVAEAATIAGISPQALRVAGLNGKIPLYRRGNSGPYFIKRDELQDYLTPVRVDVRAAS